MLPIRRGAWKLIPQLGSGGFLAPRGIKPNKDGPQGQLYRMDRDLAETNNLWQAHPEVVAELTQIFKRYRESGRSVSPR
ncbi:MAG: hypothetical protein ABGZ17_13760 [Planctomycetaceae bacterium]